MESEVSKIHLVLPVFDEKMKAAAVHAFKNEKFVLSRVSSMVCGNGRFLAKAESETELLDEFLKVIWR